ncbi:MAG TPA: hypothetical protein VH593_27045, partial [Ktedonobacteraceae bacterium]
MTEEWIAGCVSALDMSRREEFVRLRGFPSIDHLNRALPDLGWYAQWNKWIIPIRNINGECWHVKAWSPNRRLKPKKNPEDKDEYYEKWSTIGMAAARHQQHTQNKAIGQLFDLNWVIQRLHDANNKKMLDPSNRWLWVTAGEFDCLMLRCFGWLSTTLTVGEGSALSVDFFERELGGIESAYYFLSLLSGICLVYDTDDTGVRGMQRHAILFDKLFERIDEWAVSKKGPGALPETFMGVRAVDLRQHPQWELINSPKGWDVSDLVRWSLSSNDRGVSKWLKDSLEAIGSGAHSISSMLGLEFDENAGAPTIGDIIIPGIHTMTIEELIWAGIDYLRGPGNGSRNLGWYHMAVAASRNHWNMDQLWYGKHSIDDETLGKYDDASLFDILTAISRKLWPDKPDMPESEIRSCFESSFVDFRQPAFVLDDVSNMLRLFAYYPFNRYKPGYGWFWWNRVAWRSSDTKIFDCAKKIGAKIAEEAARLRANNGDPKLVGRMLVHAKNSRMMPRINAMITAASKDALGRPDNEDEYGGGWDLHAWRLATNKGVF